MNHQDRTLKLATVALLKDQVATDYVRRLYARAMSTAVQLERLIVELYGREHPEYADVSAHLGRISDAMGDYRSAERSYLRCLETRRKILGPADRRVGVVLGDLGSLYTVMGDYESAKACLGESLEIIESPATDDEVANFAITLDHTGVLAQALGDYTAAAAAHSRALRTLGTLAQKYPSIAVGILLNSARVERARYNFAEAERQCRLAVRTCGPSLQHSLDYANCLHELALISKWNGEFSVARSLCTRAVNVKRSLFVERHPDVAIIVHDLGLIELSLGNYVEAVALFAEALDMHASFFAEEHPQHAFALEALGVAYWAMGDHVKAEHALSRCVELSKETLGPKHPRHANAQYNLAFEYASNDRHTEALALMLEAARTHDALITEICWLGSENDRLAAARGLVFYQDALMSLVVHKFRGVERAVQRAFEVVLARKGVTSDAAASQRSLVLAGRYPNLRSKFDELTAIRERMAQADLVWMRPREAQPNAPLYDSWKQRKEQLERDLAREIADTHILRPLPSIAINDVAAAIPAGSALIEFVKFEFVDFGGPQANRPSRYIAFVLRAGQPDSLQLVDLGDANSIERLLSQFLSSVAHEADELRNEAGGSHSSSAGTALRARVLDPLMPALLGDTKLLISTDGELMRLPFDSLPGNERGYLIDQFEIAYLSAGRDVLHLARSLTSTAAVIAGDPDFDLDDASTIKPADTATGGNTRLPSRQRVMLSFERLPGTRLEVERVASFLKVQPWIAETVLKKRIKSLHSPLVLHIATHGYFIGDDSGYQIGQGGLTTSLVSIFRLSVVNPLLRSGIALAGANAWLQGRGTPPEAQDGLLTADDVAGMDLLDTELVVLSACDTGLGEIQVGQGVLGFRRAFAMAGARTLIMSLWKVSDLATAVLMERFYALLSDGIGRAEAFRRARMYTRDLTVADLRKEWLSEETMSRLLSVDREGSLALQTLARRSDDHKPFRAPFYWASFICQGYPTSLGEAVRRM